MTSRAPSEMHRLVLKTNDESLKLKKAWAKYSWNQMEKLQKIKKKVEGAREMYKNYKVLHNLKP